MTHDNKHSTDNAVTNDVSDNKASTTINDRRNSLKKMAIGTTVLGGATTTQWSQPIINSVISPAHAQATANSCSGSQTFDSPGEFEFIVPDCATQVTVEVRGAGGGDAIAGVNTRDTVLGGIGGLSTGTLQASPGEILTVIVGEQGEDIPDNFFGLGEGGLGYGNGGDGVVPASDSLGLGAGGGGGSAILQNGTAVVVAGGGGGALSNRTGTNEPVVSGRAGHGGGATGGTSAFTGSSFGQGVGGSNGVGGNLGNERGGPRDGGGGFGGGGGGGFGGGSALGGGGGGLAGPNGTTETGGGNSGDGSITISW